MPQLSKTLAEIRSDVCNTTLIVLWCAAVPGLAASLSRLFDQGWLPVMGLHILLMGYLSVVVTLRARLSFPVRAWTIIGTMFVVGAGGILSFGMLTGVVSFLVGASILAACLMGVRTGVTIAGASCLVLVAAFFGFHSGVLAQPDFTVAALSITTWITAAFTLAMACAGPVIAVARFTRDLEHERARAERANHAKSEFLAVMSHELRTPLTGVVGITELLREETLTATQGEWVERLGQSAHLLMDLISDILDFSKIEAGQLAIENVPFAMADVVQSVQAATQPAAARKGLAVVWRNDTAAPPPLFLGDPNRIRQVLVNLVGNAIKFTDRGQVTVTLRHEARGPGTADLKIKVNDTGIGIASEMVEHLFEPFVQADSGIGRRFGGTGLGLAICHRLVTAMSGRISVASRLGAGSTFTVVIPLREAPAETVPAQSTLGRVAAKNSAKLLLAEDVATSRALITTMLTRMGHQVVAVENGQQAFEAAMAHDFDLIVMDMQMPVMDGEAATRAIRLLDGPRGAVPIVAVTADVVRERFDVFRAAGVNAVIPKPVDWAALGAEIARQIMAGSAEPVAVGEVLADADDLLDYEALAELNAVLGAEVLTPMFVTCCENLAGYRAKLRDCAAQGDATEVRRAAHAVKGLSAQFGAMRLSRHAHALELEKDQTRLNDGVRALVVEIDAAISALTAHGGARER